MYIQELEGGLDLVHLIMAEKKYSLLYLTNKHEFVTLMDAKELWIFGSILCK